MNEVELGSDDRASFLEAILQASPTFIHVLSGPNLKFEFANDAYYRLVGQRDLIGRPAFEAMPEAAAGGYPERILRVMATKEPFHGSELPVQLARTAGGLVEERLIDIVYVPLLEQDGSCHRVLGHGTDVTENVSARRNAQDAQRRTLKRLESSLAAGRMATWEWNVEQDILIGSALMTELFGVVAGAATTHTDFSRGLLHPEDRAPHSAIVQRAISELGYWHTEYRVLSTDGAVIWCEEVAEVSRDPATNSTVVVGFVWDITSRKEAERSLREADRHKSDFLATLAHELRNPLSPIRTGLQLIKRLPAGDGRVERTLSVMDRQMDHLVRLVDDLMEVNRISKGKVELRKEPLLLHSALATALDATKPHFEAKQITLVQGPFEPVTVSGDSDRLVQIFSNLLTNALKFTEPGGQVWLSITCQGQEAVATVRDDGCGIRAEVIDGVFEMFSQGPTHHGAGGLGIGLALVRQLVELHGGTVKVESGGQGMGSTFTVHLPVAVGLLTTSGPQERPGQAKHKICHRILIVDDNKDAADSLAIALELEGFLVNVAYDGPTGIAQFLSSPPEVVLLDLGMPGMDGFEVAARLKSIEGVRFRLFALTGFGSEQDKTRVRDAGFNGHFTKPVAPQALFDTLAFDAVRPAAGWLQANSSKGCSNT